LAFSFEDEVSLLTALLEAASSAGNGSMMVLLWSISEPCANQSQQFNQLSDYLLYYLQ
jgi:hypothetical protein